MQKIVVAEQNKFNIFLIHILLGLKKNTNMHTFSQSIFCLFLHSTEKETNEMSQNIQIPVERYIY